MYPQQQPSPQSQPQGAAPGAGPAPGGAPQGQMHPEVAANLKPDDPVQGYLLQNIDQLSDQEVAALRQALGSNPPLAQVLTKIAPCVGFVWQKLAGGGGQGAQPQPGGAAPAPSGAPPAPMPQPGGGGPQRPATQLGQMQA